MGLNHLGLSEQQGEKRLKGDARKLFCYSASNKCIFFRYFS